MRITRVGKTDDNCQLPDRLLLPNSMDLKTHSRITQLYLYHLCHSHDKRYILYLMGPHRQRGVRNQPMVLLLLQLLLLLPGPPRLGCLQLLPGVGACVACMQAGHIQGPLQNGWFGLPNFTQGNVSI